MAMKKSALRSPRQWPLNAQPPEDGHVVVPCMSLCKSVVTRMADNARILMVTQPYSTRSCFHTAFCDTNFNPALLGRSGAIISWSFDFEVHLRPFIRFTRCLSCEMTAHNLGLDFNDPWIILV